MYYSLPSLNQNDFFVILPKAMKSSISNAGSLALKIQKKHLMLCSLAHGEHIFAFTGALNLDYKLNARVQHSWL
jgi:hypothetical protein